MVVSKFSLSENIIISIILLNVYAISSFQLIDVSGVKVYLIHIFIFCFLVSINLHYKTLIKPIFINFNFFSFLGFAITFFFIVSSFYINFEYTLQLKALMKLLTYPIAIFLFFYVFPKKIFKQDNLFEKFLNFYLFFSLISTLIAFIFMYLGFYPGLQFPGQTIAFFYHTNTFAFVFTFAIPMVMYKYFMKKISLIPFIILMMLMSSCLLFTLSRAGYIGVFTAILILMYKKSKKIFLIGIIIIAFLVSTIIFNFAQSKGGYSAFSRVQVIYIAYNMITGNGVSKFLWGYGVINNINVFQKELTSSFGFYREEMGPHNFIMSLGIQFGMLVTFAVVLFVLLLLLKASLLKKKKIQFEFTQRMNLSISIVTGILAECLFEDLVIYPEFFAMPLFLIFLGYLYYSVYQYHDKLRI